MKKNPPKIFFNASVILAGIKNPKGGSGKLLHWTRLKKIQGFISETIIDETLRWSDKTGKPKDNVKKTLHSIFPYILSAPSSDETEKWKNIVIDYGDCHVLASTKQSKSKYLVTLDKKHLLSLSSKIKSFRIVSPGQLIELIETR